MSSQRAPQNMMRYAGLATQWMAMLGIAVFAGYKLDKVLGWKVPVFLILFPVAALALSLWQLIKELNKPGK
jgi:branched-subunit amino acid permease